MDENEKYCRERWKALGNLWWDREYDENWISASDEQGKPIRLFRGHSTDAQAWQAAYDFTKAREEEIRQVEEEISWLTEHTEISPKLQELYDKRTWEFSAEFLKDKQTAKRILAREQTALAELQRGMKATR